MSARLWAYEVLEKILHTPRHLEPVLEEALAARPQASRRDKALASRLLYTVLRNKLWLEFILARLCRYPGLERRLKVILMLAASEMLLFRTAAYAAVNSWVSLSRQVGLGRASGLVNAVLRSLNRLPALPAAPEDDETEFLAITYSHPRWLVQEWLEQWGSEAARVWLTACQETPLPTVRVNTLKISLEEFRHNLRSSGIGSEVHPLHPWSLVINKSGLPLPGFREGWWQGQDAGATALTACLAPQSGSRVLDLCAGTGGKSGQLAQHMQNRGQLLAVDISPGRVNAWRKNMTRLGVSCARIVESDAGRLKAGETGLFDYILLDAPCSGLGTTRGHPDTRWKKTPASSAAALPGQRRLLGKAAELLASGGKLLYATCTTAAAENSGNIEWLLDEFPELRILYLDEDSGGYWQTFPQPRQSEGFFAASLEKK